MGPFQIFVLEIVFALLNIDLERHLLGFLKRKMKVKQKRNL